MYSRSCPTLWDPMDHNLPGSSVHGIFQARTLEWAAVSFSSGSTWPRDQIHVSRICWVNRQILYHLICLLPFTSISECCQSSLLNTNEALDSSSLHLLHPPTLPWATQALELWFRVRTRSRSLSKRLCTWVCVFSLSYTLTMEPSGHTLASAADWTPTSISALFHFSNNLCEFYRTCGYFIREFLIFQAIVMAMWPSPQICEVTYATSWIFFFLVNSLSICFL